MYFMDKSPFFNQTNSTQLVDGELNYIDSIDTPYIGEIFFGVTQ